MNTEILNALIEKRRAESAPDVSALVEALEGIMRVEARGRIMPVGAEWDAARAALAAYRQGGGE